MIALPFKLSPLVELTDEAFIILCQANPEAKFERNAKGELIVMSPTGGYSGNRNIKLSTRLQIWTERDGTGIAFDSSTMFKLPNQAFRSPDAAWISLPRWEALSESQQQGFPPICPDFVIELRSPSDSLSDVQTKMQEYMNNGTRLGWLINPQDRQVEIYRQEREKEVVETPGSLSGEKILPGLILDLSGIL
jgi:Uma2 family endonuclease